MKKILALSLFLLPFIANAGDIPSPRWKLITINDNQNSFFYIDSNTKTKTSAWIWKINSTPVKSDDSILGPRMVKSIKAKYVFQCQTKKFGPQETITYYQDGKANSEKVNQVVLSEAVPDSIGESLIEYLCKK